MKQQLSQQEGQVYVMPVRAIIRYIQTQTGAHLEQTAWQRGLELQQLVEAGRLPRRLHLNVGQPGGEIPKDPVEANEELLLAALLWGRPRIPVLLYGDCERAWRWGLISPRQWRTYQAAMERKVIPYQSL